MFKRGWLRRGRISSDEGFSISMVDRTHLLYRDGQRKVTIAGEMLANGFALYRSTIGPWDDSTPIDDQERQRIADRIKRALESQGMVADIA
jgi:hypothetical protein